MERELNQAEIVFRIVEELAIRWTSGNLERTISGSDEEQEGVLPRSEYVYAMHRLAEFIRKRFPPDTEDRWEDMARVAAEDEAGPDHPEL